MDELFSVDEPVTPKTDRPKFVEWLTNGIRINSPTEITFVGTGNNDGGCTV